MSMAQDLETWFFASVTNELPGQKILSTGFTLSVQKPMANTACAHPIL